MASKSEKNGISVAYIPHSTFTGFIEKLKNSAVPSVIDTSVLQNLSGSTRTQLMSALKVMKLIDANGTVKPELRELVKAYQTDGWAEALKQVVSYAYAQVVSDVDLDTGTISQLERAFKENGNVDGQVLDKAVRFYLSALKAAGITYSPHFDARKPRRVPTAKKPKKQGAATQGDGDDESGDEADADAPPIHKDGKRLQFRLPIRGKVDAIISLPEDVTGDDWAILKVQLDAFITPPKAKGG